MMKFQLDDVARRGEALAGLTASEAVIYGRFGYGVASQFVEATVKKTAALLRDAPTASGRIRMVWDDERAKVLPPIFDEWRRQRPGSVDRSEGRWQQLLIDREFDRGGASALFYAVHEDKRGVADGYVSYRIKEGAHEGDADGTCIVREVIAVDPEVEAALWRFVLDIDLVSTFSLRYQPVDSQLPWRLVDSRGYDGAGVWDFLWLWNRVPFRAIQSSAALVVTAPTILTTLYTTLLPKRAMSDE